MGSSSPSSGENEKYLSCHKLDIFLVLTRKHFTGGLIFYYPIQSWLTKTENGSMKPKYYGILFRWLDTPLLISWEYDERCLGLYVGPKNSSPQKNTKIEKPLG